MMDENNDYMNYTGCGNTVNANNPMTKDFILASLRHWVQEYKVDGFRFDLASCLTRDERGRPMETSAHSRDCKRSYSVESKTHRGTVGCRRVVPSRRFSKLGPVGRMEREVSRHVSTIY